MNNLKKNIRKQILLKFPVKTIMRNILKGSKAFTIMSFLYIVVFTICLLLLYKHFRENKKHYSQTGKSNTIHVQDEQKNLSLQIKNLNQDIYNIEVKINKIIIILEKNNSLCEGDLGPP